MLQYLTRAFVLFDYKSQYLITFVSYNTYKSIFADISNSLQYSKLTLGNALTNIVATQWSKIYNGRTICLLIRQWILIEILECLCSNLTIF